MSASVAGPPSPKNPAVFAGDPAINTLLLFLRMATTRWPANTYRVPDWVSRASPPRPRDPRHTVSRCAPATVEVQVEAPVPAYTVSSPEVRFKAFTVLHWSLMNSCVALAARARGPCNDKLGALQVPTPFPATTKWPPGVPLKRRTVCWDGSVKKTSKLFKG